MYKNEDVQSVANYLVVEEVAEIYYCCLKKRDKSRVRLE